jgi:hypothetical protein
LATKIPVFILSESLLKRNEAITAIAVADTDYPAGGTLYAGARLTESGKPADHAESPGSSSVYMRRPWPRLAIGTEDGSYQDNFQFGEFWRRRKDTSNLPDKPNLRRGRSLNSRALGH